MTLGQLQNIASFHVRMADGTEDWVPVEDMITLVAASMGASLDANAGIATADASSTSAGTDNWEHQFPTEEDFSLVRTVNSNNQSTNVTKQRLAAIVGELLPKSITYQRLLTSADDCNNLEDGIYWYINGANPANASPGSANVLMVQLSYPRHSYVEKSQIELIHNGFNIKYRQCFSNVWKEWKTLH